jgi:DME family drug/metabolite transporter
VARRPVDPALAIGATLLAATLWGTSFSVNDRGLAYVGPAAFVALRFAVGGVLVLGVALATRRLDVGLLRSPLVWALGAANALGFLLQYFGQTMTTPARTALFVNTSAFAVALIERYVLGARLGWRRALAIVAGVAGAGLLIVGGSPSELLVGDRILGDLLTLASGLAWSVYFVMNDRAVARHDPMSVTGWTFALSALFALPALLIDPRPLAWSPEGAFAVLYAGIATTALAYGLWSYGLRGIRPSASALLLLVEILVASIVSLALRRETFGPVEIAGALLLVAAVVGMSFVAARPSGSD